MVYAFSKMTQSQAENIAVNWHYQGQYAFYDFSADEEDLAELLNPETRGENYYMVMQGDEEIGFFYVDKIGDTVDIGLGMKPELTGKGLGLDFLKSGLNYVRLTHHPKEITLSVATFNDRAIHVYEKAGFKPVKTYSQATNGSHFTFLKMTYSDATEDAPSF